MGKKIIKSDEFSEFLMFIVVKIDNLMKEKKNYLNFELGTKTFT